MQYKILEICSSLYWRQQKHQRQSFLMQWPAH